MKRVQGAIFPRRAPDLWSGRARLYTLTGSGEDAPINFPLVRYPDIDRFPDGRWFVASARADVGQANGLVLEADGQVSRSFEVGDGIEHVRCAPDGSIWVGYFDEGVFGNTVGSGGIVSFNVHGERLWSYNDPARGGRLFVDDCYALTLNGDELWSCFYSDFPIVRVVDARETQWANSVSGAKALAVDGTFVLLAGGYQSDATRLSLLDLGQEQSRLIGSYEQPEMNNAALMQGRSSDIHVVNNGTWTRISVAEARSYLGVS